MVPGRKRALLAIAFAGGILNSQLPALAEHKHESKNSVVQQLAHNEKMSPELRAYYLLTLADNCLTGEVNKAAVEARFKSVASQTQNNSVWIFEGRWNKFFDQWIENVASEARSTPQMSAFSPPMKPEKHPIPIENKTLASKAIQQALSQLSSASNQYVRLNLYFVASRLLRKIGNTDGVRHCNMILEAAFKACQSSTPVDEQQIKGAISVLNAMSYRLIPVRIPEYKTNYGLEGQSVPSFAEKDFKESEKLKLTAAKIADRLDTHNHTRRMVHRDLALWYMKLGKVELAEQQKEILFQLVGVKDDSILYPHERGCGRVAWWQKHNDQVPCTVGCGMG